VRLPCSPLPEPGPVGVISRSHPSAETDAYLTANGVREVIRRGSSVKMCAVAEGAADVYPRLAPTWFWDTAAGTVIAREAGCRVVDTAGRDLVYDLSGMLKQEDGFVVLAPNARLRGR
jgi:3'(2'), 5'-bisphosphate nucleotidase